MTLSWRLFTCASAGLLFTSCTSDLLSPTRLASGNGSLASLDVSLTAWAWSPTQISLSWTDNARNESGWEVHRSTGGHAGSFTLLASVGSNATGYGDSGLSSGTEYCYKVRSFRTTGKKTSFAEFSEVACATTPVPPPLPPAPTAVSAVPQGSTTVYVTWTNGTDFTSLRVERASAPEGPWTGIVTYTSPTVAHSDHNRTPDITVCYRVVAINQNGESPSEPDCTAPPQRPTDLTASDTLPTHVEVKWNDASNVEDGYELFRVQSTSSEWVSIAVLPANSSSFQDENIVADTKYSYQVRAIKDGGFSWFSNSDNGAVMAGPPAAPVIAAYSSGSTVGVVYLSVSGSTSHVRIQRSPDGESGWVTVDSIPVPDWPGFVDENRTPEQLVCYRAYASNKLGESGASNVDCTRPLAQPDQLTITTHEDGSSTTTWRDNSNYEDFYFVTVYYCYPGWGCEYYYDAWLDANSTTITTGPEEVAHDVRACDAESCSDLAISGDGATGAVLAGLRSAHGAAATAGLAHTQYEALRKRIKAARRR